MLQVVWGGRPRPPPLKLVLDFGSQGQTTLKSKSTAADEGARPTHAHASSCRINSQHFNQIGHFAEMMQGVASGLVVSAKKVGVEHIFPGPPTQRPRLYFGQADVTQSEYCQRLEERAGNVLDAEGNRSLIRSRKYAPRLADQKEAGEVAFVIFDAGRQNVAFVGLGGLGACDSGSILQFVF